jgi:ribosomal protein L24
MPDDNEAQPADMTKAPAVGDVIQIKRGPDKGKYGVIAAINPDFTFEYNEVSKEHALIILRGKM